MNVTVTETIFNPQIVQTNFPVQVTEQLFQPQITETGLSVSVINQTIAIQVAQQNLQPTVIEQIIETVTVQDAGPKGDPGAPGAWVSENITGNRIITTADKFKRLYTTGATGTINLTLSDIEADDEFIFVVRENFRVNIILDSGQTLQLAPGNIATSSIYNNKKGAVIHIWAESPETLQALYELGNWIIPS